jgi:hypothetical protein
MSGGGRRSPLRRASSNQLRDELFRPYRDIAVRVLACAFQDLVAPQRTSDRESARRFFAGSGMMYHWCRVAALDPGCVVNHAARLNDERSSDGLRARHGRRGSSVRGGHV